MAFGRGVFVCLFCCRCAVFVFLPSLCTGNRWHPLSGNSFRFFRRQHFRSAISHQENVATGMEHTVTTNDHGFYTAVNLLAGSYQVTISATGFDTEAKSGITMYVGRPANFRCGLACRHGGKPG